MRLFILGLFIILDTYASFGQRGLQRPRAGSGPETDINSEHTAPDTLDVGYYLFGDYDSLQPYLDTTLRGFNQYDINEIQNTSYFNLGYPGSAARPVIPAVSKKAGFRLGLNQYDPYRLKSNKFKFYQSEKAFSSARFTQGPTQEDGVFSLQFGRDFKDNISLALDYRRTNNVGFYLHQKIRNTQFGLGLRMASENSKWKSEVLYLTNRFNHQENGGFTTDTAFAGVFGDNRLDIPVATTMANTSDQEYGIELKSSYALIRDSVAQQDKIKIGHHLEWKRRNYLFYDDGPPNEAYYGRFAVDTRGLRQGINQRVFSNDFFIELGKTAAYEKIVLGIRNESYVIDQLHQRQSFYNWIAHGQASWNLTDWVHLQGRAEIAVGGGFESYTSEGKVQIKLGGAGYLEGLLNLNNLVPTQIQSNLSVNQDQIWQNNFKNILQNHLKVTYKLPKLNLAISAGQFLQTNGIYFSSDGIANQQSGTSLLSYIRFYNRSQFGVLVTENKVILQFSQDHELFQIPTWHTENSLLLSGKLFKNVLEIETGFDLRVFDRFSGLTYFPLLGQFILEERFSIPRYPVLDFRLGFKVKYFRAFAEAENILELLGDEISIQTSRYPQQEFNLRIGISWVFIN